MKRRRERLANESFGWRAMAFDYGRTRRALFHPSESTGADYTRASRKLSSVLSRSPNREVDAKIVLHNIRCSPDLLSNELAHNYTTNSDRLENPWHSPHSCKTCLFDLSSVRAGQERFFFFQDECAQPKVRIRNQKKTKKKKHSQVHLLHNALRFYQRNARRGRRKKFSMPSRSEI